jgi:uncharacterized protein (TIGR02118 family)
MIKVSVLYEDRPGQKFDMAYYTAKHIPMVKQKLGAACKRAEVDQGLAGVQPGSKPRFIAQAHFLFDSVEAFQQAFAPHAQAIMADIPNYTTLEPIIQVNEVKL